MKINLLDGRSTTFGELVGGKVALVVNVASRCGLTPQYSALEDLHRQFGPRGFTVIGVPCNQFAAQEPDAPEVIQTFCSSTYGVTFPLTEKINVNGPARHPLYAEMTRCPDPDGDAGNVQWNFEKFLLAGDLRVVARFRPSMSPDDPAVVSAIESLLGRISAA